MLTCHWFVRSVPNPAMLRLSRTLCAYVPRRPHHGKMTAPRGAPVSDEQISSLFTAIERKGYRHGKKHRNMRDVAHSVGVLRDDHRDFVRAVPRNSTAEAATAIGAKPTWANKVVERVMGSHSATLRDVEQRISKIQSKANDTESNRRQRRRVAEHVRARHANRVGEYADTGSMLHPCLRQLPGGQCPNRANCPFIRAPADLCLNMLKHGSCRQHAQGICPYRHDVAEEENGLSATAASSSAAARQASGPEPGVGLAGCSVEDVVLAMRECAPAATTSPSGFVEVAVEALVRHLNKALSAAVEGDDTAGSSHALGSAERAAALRRGAVDAGDEDAVAEVVTVDGVRALMEMHDGALPLRLVHGGTALNAPSWFLPAVAKHGNCTVATVVHFAAAIAVEPKEDQTARADAAVTLLRLLNRQSLRDPADLFTEAVSKRIDVINTAVSHTEADMAHSARTPASIAEKTIAGWCALLHNVSLSLLDAKRLENELSEVCDAIQTAAVCLLRLRRNARSDAVDVSPGPHFEACWLNFVVSLLALRDDAAAAFLTANGNAVELQRAARMQCRGRRRLRLPATSIESGLPAMLSRIRPAATLKKAAQYVLARLGDLPERYNAAIATLADRASARNVPTRVLLTPLATASLLLLLRGTQRGVLLAHRLRTGSRDMAQLELVTFGLDELVCATAAATILVDNVCRSEARFSVGSHFLMKVLKAKPGSLMVEASITDPFTVLPPPEPRPMLPTAMMVRCAFAAVETTEAATSVLAALGEARHLARSLTGAVLPRFGGAEGKQAAVVEALWRVYEFSPDTARRAAVGILRQDDPANTFEQRLQALLRKPTTEKANADDAHKALIALFIVGTELSRAASGQLDVTTLRAALAALAARRHVDRRFAASFEAAEQLCLAVEDTDTKERVAAVFAHVNS
jgi:hypothetical protein